MPYEIRGWVEVAYAGEAEPEPAWLWFGAIDLGTLVHSGDEVSARLFGLSRRYAADHVLAAEQGLPSNPSERLKHDLDRIAALETKHGVASGFGGFTHASWAEIKSFAVRPDLLEDSQWKLVFSLLAQLEQSFSSDRIRIVAWYDW